VEGNTQILFNFFPKQHLTLTGEGGFIKEDQPVVVLNKTDNG
jgi:hypothetical protein